MRSLEDVGVMVKVFSPGFAVAVYLVAAKPPTEDGAVTKLIVGTPLGVNDAEALDDSEVPAEFVAVIVKVYAVPAVSPVMGMEPEPVWDTVAMIPPGFDVALYWVIAEPPLESGAVKATVAEFAPVAVAAPIVGAPGGLNVVTEADGLDGTEVPAALVAVTVKV